MLRHLLTNLSNYIQNKPVSGYLYVPFTKDELTDTVKKSIEEFKDHSSKIYTIIYYQQFDLSQLPEGTKIYIMGHGLDISPNRNKFTLLNDPKLPYEELQNLLFSDWSYSISGGKQAISIDTIAKRIKEDGLLNANNIHMKLWNCDPNNKAHAIAKRFIDHFKDSQNTYRVDYYLNRFLTNPLIKDGHLHKWASIETGNPVGTVRASAIRQSLFNKVQIQEGNIGVCKLPSRIDLTKSR